jgi:hypothetical protein
MRKSCPGIGGTRAVAALPFIVLTAAACTGTGENAEAPADAGAGDARTAPSRRTWTEAGAVSPEDDDAAPPRGSIAEPNDPDAQAEASVRPSCVPSTTPDVPDDDFADTNCDGIDGDVASAVFVAPTGGDEGTGSLDAPVRSLNGALMRAKELNKSAIYACVGTYDSNVVISDPIEIYGGFDCERGWKRVNDVAAVRPEAGQALLIHRAKRVLLRDLSFRSESKKAAGESSIAVAVSKTEDVRFDRVVVIAGDAAPGVPGVNPVHTWGPARPAAPGRSVQVSDRCAANASCTAFTGASATNPECRLVSAGGSGGPSFCPDGHSVKGGEGGRGANCGLGLPELPGLNGAPASSSQQDVRTGERGESGKAGVVFGYVTGGTYVPPFGSAGGWGKPGFAGRGGDGTHGATSNGDVVQYFQIGGGGGQGGYPGCGGPGGGGGGGGGGSIAIVVENSKLQLTRSRLVTGRGGDGGEPAYGVEGQPGGAGGLGAVVSADANLNGSPGRAGTNGGPGGPGGPGAGGPSIGIVHVGDAPEVDDATLFELGEPGKGATGGTVADDGIKKEIHFQAVEVTP